MSDAFRCDITGECIPQGESPNTYWTVDSGTTTILGVPNIGISLEIKVTIPGNGKKHMSQAAREAVQDKVKQYVSNNW